MVLVLVLLLVESFVHRLVVVVADVVAVSHAQVCHKQSSKEREGAAKTISVSHCVEHDATYYGQKPVVSDSQKPIHFYESCTSIR